MRMRVRIEMPLWLLLLLWLVWVSCIIALFYVTNELSAMKALQGVAL